MPYKHYRLQVSAYLSPTMSVDHVRVFLAQYSKTVFLLNKIGKNIFRPVHPVRGVSDNI